MKKQLVEFVVERTPTGYSAYATHYDVYTVGATLAELRANMVEAMLLHLADEGCVIIEADLEMTLNWPH